MKTVPEMVDRLRRLEQWPVCWLSLAVAISFIIFAWVLLDWSDIQQWLHPAPGLHSRPVLPPPSSLP